MPMRLDQVIAINTRERAMTRSSRVMTEWASDKLRILHPWGATRGSRAERPVLVRDDFRYRKFGNDARAEPEYDDRVED